MAEIILKTLITFFVVYALIDIFSKAARLIFKSGNKKSEMFVVIRVKNQEASIEYIIRTLIWRFLSRNGGGRVPFILIVDMGSDDKTSEISQRLCDDYEFVYYTTEEQYNKAKNTLFI